MGELVMHRKEGREQENKTTLHLRKTDFNKLRDLVDFSP